MVNTVILWAVALASFTSVAFGTDSETQLGLDTTGGKVNKTDLLRVIEEKTSYGNGNSVAVRRSCSPTISCTLAGGHCVRTCAHCNGTKDYYGCFGGRDCMCCIPDQTTPTFITTTPDNTTTLDITTTPDITTAPDITTTPNVTTTPDITTTPAMTTTPDITTTPALTTVTVPAGFDEFHGRVIRRTITSDTKGGYDGCMSFCYQFGAKPFIPLTVADYTLYKTVRNALGRNSYMWLPANDRLQEGTLRWYNGEVASNISLWDWNQGQDLSLNSGIGDCLFYGCCGVNGPIVYMLRCSPTFHPPICEMI